MKSGSFQEAVGPVLALAQFFAVMPLSGIKSSNVADLKFAWKSVRTVYACCILLLISINGVLSIIYLSIGNMEFTRIVPVIFYTSNAYAMACFIRLGMKWPLLMQQWESVEQQLPQLRTQKERSRLPYQIRMISTIVLMLSMGEHLLSIITSVHTGNKCMPTQNPFENVLILQLPHVFYFIDYTTFNGIVAKSINIVSTFIWTFMDLFVMIISIGLASRFRLINHSLNKHKGMIMPEEFWIEHRIWYRNICDLCETIDREMGTITLVSFSNNLCFICVQLLFTLNFQPSVAHSVYFWYSLAFLIVRTLAVSLYSAEINDESKQPLKVFRFVPTESWCLEIKRFSCEVTRDVVALSGMRFFHLTRTLVLSVAGTIITYELVLVQFHKGAKQDECE